MDFLFYFLQDAQAFLESGATEAFQGRAVGLVVGRFENERDVQGAGDALDDFRHANGVLFTFDDARAGDQEESAGTDADVVELEADRHRAIEAVGISQPEILNHEGHEGHTKGLTSQLLVLPSCPLW